RRGGDRDRALADDRLDEAWRHDPRRRRRRADRARRRHQGVPAVHPGVRAWRGPRRFRGRRRRTVSFGLSRARRRNAAARIDRGHPGGDGQPARRARRQLRDRFLVQFRSGDVSRSRLCDPVPADAAGAGAASPGPVRASRVMSAVTAPRAAIAVALVLLLALPTWVGNPYYINISSQILLLAVFALALHILIGAGRPVS